MVTSKAYSSWSVPVIVTTFPRTVRVIEHLLIPLKDGTRLAARIWLPDDIEPGLVDLPHPALGQDLTPSPTARRAQAGTGVRA